MLKALSQRNDLCPLFALFCLKLLLITAHEAVSKRCVQAETIISTLSPTKAKFVTLIASEDI